MTAVALVRFEIRCNFTRGDATCGRCHLGQPGQGRARVRRELAKAGWTTAPGRNRSPALALDFCPDHPEASSDEREEAGGPAAPGAAAREVPAARTVTGRHARSVIMASGRVRPPAEPGVSWPALAHTLRGPGHQDVSQPGSGVPEAAASSTMAATSADRAVPAGLGHPEPVRAQAAGKPGSEPPTAHGPARRDWHAELCALGPVVVDPSAARRWLAKSRGVSPVAYALRHPRLLPVRWQAACAADELRAAWRWSRSLALRILLRAAARAGALRIAARGFWQDVLADDHPQPGRRPLASHPYGPHAPDLLDVVAFRYPERHQSGTVHDGPPGEPARLISMRWPPRPVPRFLPAVFR